MGKRRSTTNKLIIPACKTKRFKKGLQPKMKDGLYVISNFVLTHESIL
jgi:hypothetical protein